MEKTSSCLSRVLSFWEVFAAVGNKIIKVLGFTHILPEGASFPKPHQLVLKSEQKNSKNMGNLASATPVDTGAMATVLFKECLCVYA